MEKIHVGLRATFIIANNTLHLTVNAPISETQPAMFHKVPYLDFYCF